MTEMALSINAVREVAPYGREIPGDLPRDRPLRRAACGFFQNPSDSTRNPVSA